MSFVRPKPVSAAFYLGSYLGGMLLGGIILVLGIVGVAGGAAASEEGHEAGMVFAGIGGLLLVVGFVICIFAAVVLFVLYYKMWAAIQDGYARTTPGMAVGLMFVPLFNLYWKFQVMWGYSKDYNAFIHRYQIQAHRLPESLFLSFCILSLLCCIPYINMLAVLPCSIIQIILLVKICAAINALAYAPEATVTAQPAGELPRENWRGM